MKEDGAGAAEMRAHSAKQTPAFWNAAGIIVSLCMEYLATEVIISLKWVDERDGAVFCRGHDFSFSLY